MTTPTLGTRGWYVDPTGRHEHRYWDGTNWSASVSDAGVTTTDEPEPAGLGGPTAQGYRAVAVRTWRVAAVYAVPLICMAALVFEVIATARLRASGSDPSRWSWLYHEGPGLLLYGYPPLGAWLGLALTSVLGSALLVSSAQALKKAGCSVRWSWSAPVERRRLAEGLRRLGYGRTLLRARGRDVLVVLAELAALLLVAVSGYAVFAREGMVGESVKVGGRAVGNLSVGLGPKVCLAVGLVSAVLLLLAWPWGRQQHVLVLRDGTVRPEPPA